MTSWTSFTLRSVPARGRRRVSSDSDVPLVRGSRFAVLTESDCENDPLIRPTGQTRNEDDVNTVPASSGAVAAHLGEISGDARQVEFDMTPMDSDTESLSTHSAGQIEHQVQNNTSSRIRRRHLRLHWNEQVSRVIHREVRAAANVVENLGRRIGSVPLEGDLPATVRHQRWSPLNVPLFWAAASDSPSCLVLEWIMAAASQITQPLQFHEGQINPREAAHVRSWEIASREHLTAWLGREGFQATLPGNHTVPGHRRRCSLERVRRT